MPNEFECLVKEAMECLKSQQGRQAGRCLKSMAGLVADPDVGELYRRLGEELDPVCERDYHLVYRRRGRGRRRNSPEQIAADAMRVDLLEAEKSRYGKLEAAIESAKAKGLSRATAFRARKRHRARQKGDPR